jgi:hypothetical protein
MYPKWYTQNMLDYAAANVSFLATIETHTAKKSTGRKRKLLILQGEAFARSRSSIALPRLSELLGLPSGLSDSERGACITIANHYGASAAQDEARKILEKHPR